MHMASSSYNAKRSCASMLCTLLRSHLSFNTTCYISAKLSIFAIKNTVYVRDVVTDFLKGSPVVNK